MPNSKNQNQLQQLEKALADSKAIILTDYAGLPVSAQTELRAAIAQTGGRLQVVKNTLLKLALKNRLETIPEDLAAALQGPTAILTTPADDPISPAKALARFIADHELPTIKLGIMLTRQSLGEVGDDQILDPAAVINLSRLPGREQLLALLAGQLNAPISSFAQVLRANLQHLALAFTAIKNQQLRTNN